MYAYYHWVSTTITKEFNIILTTLNKLIYHIIASREVSITTFYDLDNVLQKEIDNYFEFLQLLLHCLTLEYQEKTHSELNPVIQSSSNVRKIEKKRVSLLSQTCDSLDKTNLPEQQIEFIEELLGKSRKYSDA